MADIHACPVCGSVDAVPVLEIRALPVHVCRLAATRQEALDAACGPIDLACCPSCGLAWNRRFDPSLLSFGPGYEASLAHSPLYREFIQDLASRLTLRFGLAGAVVVDLGCGSGAFLEALCARARCHGIGIDPSLETEGERRVGGGTLELSRRWSPDRHGHPTPALVCCMSVLEHMDDPVGFLRSIGSMTGCPHLYVDVFNGDRAIRSGEVWSIHYEQCGYYGAPSLLRALVAAGYAVDRVDSCFGEDQYLAAEGSLGRDGSAATNGATRGGGRSDREVAEAGEERHTIPPHVEAFARDHRLEIERWSEALDRFRRSGQRVVVWGTGGKGISFLNLLDTESVVECAVDVNPARQGRFTPGTAHPIVSPEALATLAPDVVIVTNRLYRTEIGREIERLGLDPTLMVA